MCNLVCQQTSHINILFLLKGHHENKFNRIKYRQTLKLGYVNILKREFHALAKQISLTTLSTSMYKHAVIMTEL